MNGLYAKITPSGPVGPLLSNNPNSSNPARLTHSQALTCDQDHAYTPEQEAVDGGKMDKFVQFTETATCSPPNYGAPGLVMDYYDGNTVTALWNGRGRRRSGAPAHRSATGHGGVSVGRQVPSSFGIIGLLRTWVA